MNMEKQFPDGMVPLGKETFKFSCHSGVSCFTKCCRKVDIVLFPYDVIRLKEGLGIDSEEFMKRHSMLVKGENTFFPTVMLKLTDDDEKACPFLTKEGCSVYANRPSACRTYPLERAVDRESEKGKNSEYYFLTNHDYCKGHDEDNILTVKEWVRNQRIDQYNLMNDLWTEMDTLFRSNPWKGEGSGGPKQQMAFMICYDIDGFRKFVASENLVKKYQITKDQKRRMKQDDAELQKIGFEWLKLILTGRSSLVAK